jgi:hypothetical protein
MAETVSLADQIAYQRRVCKQYEGGGQQPMLRAILATLEGMAAPDEWRPIETAPKDGTRFLWCGDNGEFARTRHTYCVIHWPEYEDCFLAGKWQPLPKPPVTP